MAGVSSRLRMGHRAIGVACAISAVACGGSSSEVDSGAAPSGNAAPATAPTPEASAQRLSGPDGDAVAASEASSPSPIADAGTTPRDGSTSTPSTAPSDAAPSAIDGAVASTDASAAPYKGVANSACGDLGRLGVTWFYNWTLNASGCTTHPFVPMIWGHTGKEQSASGITSEMGGIVSAGYDTVLGFNEPDNSSQSNISVTTAISLWPSFTATPGVRVGSPATQANSSGQSWMTSFMKQVNADTTGTLRVDFIAAHWYGWNSGSCDAKATNLESYIKWLEAIPGNRPIWLTEWGCLNQSNPTEATVQAFFTGAVAMFANHPRIERYAWYPWTTNNELVADGGLTPLGVAFAAAPAHR